MRAHLAFSRNRKVKEVDGVYRHKESGSLMLLKHMWIKGFIDEKTSTPYDAYMGYIHLENQEPIKRCIIDCDNLEENYEKIF